MALTMQSECCGDMPGGDVTVYAYAGSGGPPIPIGEPLEVPPPCSNVPPEAKDCCLEGSGGGNGGGGGGCGGPFAGPPIGGRGANGAAAIGGPPHSCRPIHYGTGEIVLAAQDVVSHGFGKPWGHARSFASRQSVSEPLGNGFNWKVAQWSYLTFDFDGNVVVQGKPNESRWFDKHGSDYTGKFNIKETLSLDEPAGLYSFTELDGAVTQFDQDTGRFVSYTDAGGNITQVTGVHANDYNITQVERTFTLDGDTTTEQLYYEYDASTGDQTLSRVTLRRKVNAGAWTDVSRASYTYYEDDTDAHGASGDLKTVITAVYESSAWTDTGTTLYRYYKSQPGASSSSSSSSSSSGGSTLYDSWRHLLKYVVLPDSYQRLADDPEVTDPLTAADSLVAQYADHYFEYDAQSRVTLESGHGGETTNTFAYSQSENDDGYNSWKYKTVETQPGGVVNTLYLNHAYQPMLRVWASGDEQWLEFHKYDDARVVLHATPAAVNGYDEAYADLLNETAGDYEYLNDSAGQIDTFEYHQPTGWPALESVQEGQDGSAIKLREFQYFTPNAASSSSSSSSSSGGGSSAAIYRLEKLIVYPSDTDQTKKITTSYSYTFHAGTEQILQKTTTLPVVSAAQNGSGSAATRREVFDIRGNLEWTMDERGFITRHVYDVPSGARIKTIQDVDTTQTSDEPAGWSTPAGGGLHLVTDHEHDELGRVTQTLGPLHTVDLDGVATSLRSAAWIVHDDDAHETRSARGYALPISASSASSASSSSSSGSSGGSEDNYTYTLGNPVSIVKRDDAGHVLEQISATRASTSGRLVASDTFAQSSYVRWTTNQRSSCCEQVSTRIYHTIPASGDGSSGVHYEQTDFAQSARGVRNRVKTPGGTITSTVFDARDLPIAVYIGTDDTAATDSDPTGGGAQNNNMVLVTANQYDSGSDGENALVTRVTQHVDSSTTRVTANTYDYRGRQTAIDGELDFYEKRYFDNLGRSTKVERYDTTAGGNLIARSETFYDVRGATYQTKRYAVDPSDGSVGNALVSNTWYGASGRKIKDQPAGSKLFTKTVYDGLGRVTKTYRGYDVDETSYADASSVTGDTILEQSEPTYDAAGAVIQTTTRARFHNATGTGELSTPGGSQPKARVTHTAAFPDCIGRSQAAADYGTFGGAAFSRPNIIPNRADTILVTSTEYDDSGQAYKTTDPAGAEHRQELDDAGRVTKTIQNYTDGDPSTGGADEDVTVETTYTGDGQVLTLTAKNGTTGGQTTTYVYGTTLTDSDIARADLPRAEICPDSDDVADPLGNGVDGVFDRVEYTYNRLGQRTTVKDQNGSVHTYTFDALGRETEDAITTLAAGVDGAVRRITKAYEVRGMVDTITSHDASSGGNVVNQSVFEYNDAGLLSKEYQEHSGAKDSSTPYVGYNYDETASSGDYTKGLRPTSVRYPNGRLVHTTYGATDSTADAMNRAAAINADSGGSPGGSLAEYEYLGAGVVTEVDYPEPDLRYDLAHGAGDGPYDGLDRFGRVVDLLWYDYGSSADAVRIQHGYDRAGSRLYREDPVAAANSQDSDELYAHDGAYQLTDFDRGNLNGAKDGLVAASMNFAQEWSLDPTGNWTTFKQDDDGDSSWDLNQSRTHNKVNEITQIAASGSHVAQDRNGAMTKTPKPSSWSAHFDLTYDAWSRLVKVMDGTATVVEYAYDGRNRRTGKTVSGATRHFLYNEAWQCLEERLDASTDPDRQFVWGLRYVDDLVLRDRDTSDPVNGVLDERLYALQDPNWNVVAVADTTGDVQERYAYTAYGKPAVLTTVFGARGASSHDWEYRYTGRRWNSETGFYYYRNRDYIAELGRFLRRDPIDRQSRELSDYNDYSYGGNRPTVAVDPRGEVWMPIAGGVVGAAVVYKCHCLHRDWHKGFRQKALSKSQRDCILMARAWMPQSGVTSILPGGWTGWPQNTFLGTKLPMNSPHTRCHLLCLGYLYLPAGDIDCKTCMGFVNLVATLIHERRHMDQCRTIGVAFGDEKDAYTHEVYWLWEHVRPLCYSIDKGKAPPNPCASTAACIAAFIQTVQAAEAVLVTL